MQLLQRKIKPVEAFQRKKYRKKAGIKVGNLNQASTRPVFHSDTTICLPTPCLSRDNNDELCDYRSDLKGKTGEKGGDRTEKERTWANIASILKYLTAEENSEKDGKAEMVSDLKSFILASISGNNFPTAPSSKKVKAAIGRAE